MSNYFVPYNYLGIQFRNRTDIFKSWEGLVASSEFTLGPYIEEFEVKFSAYIKSKHTISTNTGTDALILGLRSLGIMPGDEVLTVSNTFYATIGAIVQLGAVPIFVDINDDFQMNVDLIESKISQRTKAILPVFWAGSAPDMPRIEKIADKHKLKILIDGCMAIGGKYFGKTASEFGDVTAYSMHPLKSLNVMGDGGAITTNDDQIASWLRKYRNHGMVDRDHIDFFGVNSRMQPLQAVVASIELDTLDGVIEKRNETAKKYDAFLAGLSPLIRTTPRKLDRIETYSLYMIRTEKRDALVKFLNENGIETKIHYPIPIHLQKAYKELGTSVHDLNETEIQARQILTLPCHQFLEEPQIEYLLHKIKDFFS